MRYFQKIKGDRVYLSPVNTDDAELYTKWLNDERVSVNLGNYKTMISVQSEKKILENFASEGQVYAIVLYDGDTLIGNIGLHEIDGVNRKATVGLFIGEARHRGKGYGTEALRLMVRYGFKTLNLHNIMLKVNADNNAGIACYQKAGFREFGRRRESTYKDGRYLDTVYMEILEPGAEATGE